MPVHASSYDVWLAKVREALDSINMRMEDWQAVSAFDFEREFAAGAFPDDAALRANRFWWLEQNRKINQACCLTPNCWLPRGHQEDCQPDITLHGKHSRFRSSASPERTRRIVRRSRYFSVAAQNRSREIAAV